MQGMAQGNFFWCSLGLNFQSSLIVELVETAVEVLVRPSYMGVLFIFQG